MRPETVAGLSRKIKKNENICNYLGHPSDGQGVSLDPYYLDGGGKGSL
jgi:hypothetical protein